ncbi:hypothetical protein GGS20DRAFT_549210 [Poronia punctata]|nr:hypothetical protein GGS20DRAFT_549210 [Poronia punctata]
MQIINTITAAILLAASAATAAPTAAAAIPDLTITNIKRVCNKADTSCAWTFGINNTTTTAATTSTPCSFTIKGSPASHSDLADPKTCGTYRVTAGWSGQFGPGTGYTTLAVFNNANSRIAWPAYTDKELEGGKVVSPNKAWAVTQL